MTLDFKDSRELIQKLKDKPRIRYSHIAVLTTGICIGVTLLATIRSCETELPFNPLSCSTSKCHSRQMEMTQYFQRNGVDNPAILAAAVLHPEVKRPKIMAKMAVIESPKQKVGDKGQSKGYYQVKERYWKHLLAEGKVSNDALTQTLDSQRILDALISENNGSSSKGLEAYGGSTTGKYSKKILALGDVP